MPLEGWCGGWRAFKAATEDGSGETPAPAGKPSGLAKAELKASLLRYGEHEHHHHAFIRDRRDAAGRQPGQAGFDPRTLALPASFKKELTGAQEQWWEVKSKHMDTVLCFKVGKFYEAYHMDADVVVRELDCVYMKGGDAHAGFPEIAYGRMSEALVEKGYRVARVEQTETPAMLAERKKTMPRGQPKPKCVAREICSAL
jgi:DNA mismatch repair protein MSH6